MYSLTTLKTYCDERYGDWGGHPDCGTDFDFSFNARLHRIFISMTVNNPEGPKQVGLLCVTHQGR